MGLNMRNFICLNFIKNNANMFQFIRWSCIEMELNMMTFIRLNSGQFVVDLFGVLVAGLVRFYVAKMWEL
jgi:hypothetical protein